MGGGGDGVHNFKVADYKTYKWESVPQLVRLQTKLAEDGLKDPWARNYVWKFMNPYNNNMTMKWYMGWKIPGFNRGAVIALGCMGVYITYDQLFGKKDGGHH